MNFSLFIGVGCGGVEGSIVSVLLQLRIAITNKTGASFRKVFIVRFFILSSLTGVLTQNAQDSNLLVLTGCNTPTQSRSRPAHTGAISFVAVCSCL